MQDSDSLRGFLFDNMPIRGQIVTLTSSYQEVLKRHEYPSNIACLLGEFLAAASLLGATLKQSARIILQARGSGALKTVMAECASDNKVRGIARGDFKVCATQTGFKDLFVDAVLAITIEPLQGQRYQGIVPLEGDNLSQCLMGYFAQSEQLPTSIKLAASTQESAGILVQQLPNHAPLEQSTTDWQTINLLIKTLRAKEQLHLTHNDQLYLLFKEHHVRLFDAKDMRFQCHCSRHRTARALISLGEPEIREIYLQQELIDMQCEFCGALYSFKKPFIDALLRDQNKALR